MRAWLVAGLATRGDGQGRARSGVSALRSDCGRRGLSVDGLTLKREGRGVSPVGSRRQDRGDTVIDGRTDVIDGRTDAADGRLEGARASQTWVPLLTLTHGDDPGTPLSVALVLSSRSRTETTQATHTLGHFSNASGEC